MIEIVKGRRLSGRLFGSSKVALILVYMSIALLAVLPVRSSVAVQATASRPDILVVRDGWGGERETVRKVLESATVALWNHFPDTKLPPIIVYPSGGPIMLFQRGPNDELFVHLNTSETYWSQYAFQFSHEFCHIMSGGDNDPHGQGWFEEAICETAALYTLREMHDQWRKDPPYENWRAYANFFDEYAGARLASASRRQNKPFRDWFADNASVLRDTKPWRRDLFLVVAVQLLELFEARPQHWASIAYLNTAQPMSAQTFKQYLQDWHDNSPARHREFIMQVSDTFGVLI